MKAALTLSPRTLSTNTSSIVIVYTLMPNQEDTQPGNSDSAKQTDGSEQWPPWIGECRERRIASRCRHDLHQSASPHTPWCPQCILQAAQVNFTQAQDSFLAEGAMSRLYPLRDASWNKARLRYTAAARRLENAHKGDQRRVCRERGWDKTHVSACSSAANKLLKLTHSANFVDYNSNSSEPYHAYPSITTEIPLVVDLGIRKDTAWWERPQAPDTKSKTSQSPHAKPRRSHKRHKGSLIMRKWIRERRTVYQAEEAQRRNREQRYITEAAIRRKHHLENNQYDPGFWDTPISAVIMRNHFQEVQQIRRMQERAARGGKLRSRLPRSSLSSVESVDDLDQMEVEIMRALDEAEEMEKLAKKVAGEVGYLYFVGIDEAKWKSDYMESNYALVERKRLQQIEATVGRVLTG
ncbi:hypothetical protein CC78DRAFT_545375 [Lojkania enalia]|uniref:Uncharacterized protein n=1 Tax=Lojkania enalia TaxID=147567 RepID=A0A9P4KBG7_9PLEO|nr:hypothetical protein CC78DRAFT_545375 [Didymosphaeria enalia]